MRLSARAHLWILMGLSFAALASVVAALLALRLMEARESAFADARSRAVLVASHLDQLHAASLQEAERLARSSTAQAAAMGLMSPKDCSAWLGETALGRPQTLNAMIYNAKGKLACSALPAEQFARPAELLARLAKSPRPAYGPAIPASSATGAWSQPVGAPIKAPSGAVLGSVVLHASPLADPAPVRALLASEGARLHVVDERGAALSHSLAPLDPAAAQEKASGSGLALLDGSFAARAPLRSAGWSVMVALPAERVYGPLRDVILTQTAIIALFAALAFFATRRVSSRLERAADTLARAAARPEIIPNLAPTGVLEIDRSLNQIQQAHASGELALFERSLWQTASQRSLSGLAILRQNGPDGDASVIIANPAFARLCGLAPGQKPASLLHLPSESALSDPAALAELQSAIRRNIAASREANGKDWDGAERHLSIVLTPLFEAGSSVTDLALLPDPDAPSEIRQRPSGLPLDPAGRGALFSLTLDDLTEISQREAALALHTTTDTLTGLPNRALFTDRLAQALEFANLSQAKVAVAFLDIDRFKFINETIGHQAGDWLITQTAERLSARLRPGDTLCRLGGDEFGVALANLTGSFDEAGSLVDHLRGALAEPFFYRGQEISMSCSIGVAMYPEDGQTPATLLQRADIAMFRAKDSGRSGAQFFSQEMRVAVEERLHMEQALKGALRRGEIEIHYQPKFSLATGAVVGMEALARWSHPKLGRVSPAKFIPLAEESELITLLGREALTAALRDVKVLWDAGFQNVPVAVNISARQIQPGFLEEIESALAASGLPARMLHAEITESVILPNSGSAAEFLAGLTRLGVSVALDDFGTGWSSLSMLKKLPLSYLKMDRSFVDGLGQDPEDEAIAAAIISMARALDLEVIAEGVETPLQASRLRALGAQQAQGFYMLGAKPIDELLVWLQAGAPLASAAVEPPLFAPRAPAALPS